MPNVATVRDDFDEPLSIDDLDFVSRDHVYTEYGVARVKA